MKKYLISVLILLAAANVCLAYDLPITCDTDMEKIEYWVRAQELLRLDHNKFGLDFTAKKITEEQWEQYLKSNFLPKSKKIIFELNKSREKLKVEVSPHEYDLSGSYDKNILKTSMKWSPDIEEIPTDINDIIGISVTP